MQCQLRIQSTVTYCAIENFAIKNIGNIAINYIMWVFGHGSVYSIYVIILKYDFVRIYHWKIVICMLSVTA